MPGAEVSARNPSKSTAAVWYLVAGLAATGAVAGTILLGAPLPARATPAYSTKTGFSCDKCHVSPTGGDLNAYGKAFQANGDQVPAGK